MTKGEKYLAKFKRADAKCKPCPFCGGKARVLPQYLAPFGDYYSVDCIQCHVMMKVFTRYIVQAVASWNYRNPNA